MYIDYISSKAPSSVEEVIIFTIFINFCWETSSTIKSNWKLNRKFDMDKKSQLVVHWSEKDYGATLPH